MRPVRNASIAAASLVACVGLGACTSVPPWQHGGRDVTDLTGSLNDISARWRASVTALSPSVNLPAGARCYVAGAGGQSLGDSVLCGPIRLAGDGETTWQTHAVVGSDTPSGVRLVLADAGSGNTLFRPRAATDITSQFIDSDGTTAPLDQVLDPPAVDRSDADDPQPLTAPLASGTLLTARTPSGPVSLTVRLTTAVIGPVGQQVAPPPGGSFLLAAGSNLPDAADADVSIVVAHDATSVRLPLDQLADGLSVGLAKGVGPVTVGIDYGGLVQRFDPATGKRVGDPAASFYDRIGATATASCPLLPRTATNQGIGWQPRFTCVSALNRSSYLAAPEAGSSRTVRGWAGEGKTWVVLSLTPDEQTFWAGGGDQARYTPTYFSFGTRLSVAAVDYAPRQLYVQQAQAGRPARVTAIFEVPAGERSMALHSFVTTNLAAPVGAAGAPASGAFTYPADSTFTFGPAAP